MGGGKMVDYRQGGSIPGSVGYGTGKPMREVNLLMSWWGVRWILTCGFFSFLAILWLVGVTSIWQDHVFKLLLLSKLFGFGALKLSDEVLIQAAIAGYMGALGSVVFCMKGLFELWIEGDTRKKLAHLLPRPFYGMLLAIIFFFILKAGMIGTAGIATLVEKPPPETIEAAKISAAAIGGLVGIFAEDAMSRLKVVSKALFMQEDIKTESGPPS
jgi:hypothetical protein